MAVTASSEYPDISDILARKEEGRKNASKRSFAEKIAWLERVTEELKPFRALREANRAERARLAALRNDGGASA
jgi:hypothetical protein